jgi:ABC-type transport system involved in cytochrome bd biosynthesis fused ATPase/permease subunit
LTGRYRDCRAVILRPGSKAAPLFAVWRVLVWLQQTAVLLTGSAMTTPRGSVSQQSADSRHELACAARARVLQSVAVTAAPLAAEPALDIEQLEFAWPEREPLLAIERLRLNRGERVFLSGASGSG